MAEPEPSPFAEPARQLAERFARHLLRAEFAAAHGLLTPAFAKKRSVTALTDEWTSMSTVGDPFTELGIDAELDDWPEKTKRQIRWVYVGVWSTQHVEAVIVTVERASRGSLAIGNVEFGRP
jgi:hypothetical protein